MAGGISNRRHLRLSAMGPVEVVVQGKVSQMAYLASIGRGGLGLYLHQEARPGQLLIVSLRLIVQKGDPEDLKVVTRVRWAQAVAPLWMAGVAFEKMSDSRYARLLKYLNLIEALQFGDLSPGGGAEKVSLSVKE